MGGRALRAVLGQDVEAQRPALYGRQTEHDAGCMLALLAHLIIKELGADERLKHRHVGIERGHYS
jgi:hypothetical protein